MASLRSGPGPAPTASGFSFGAGGGRHALASSAESGGGVGEDLESLSEEQQRALQLVRSGKSIFFTGEWRLAATAATIANAYMLSAAFICQSLAAHLLSI
jgi:hypothetical protein